MTLQKYAIAFLLSWTSLASADYERQYEGTITNITRGQTFTPQWLATHSKSRQLFTLGESASDALELLAEAGDTSALGEALASQQGQTGEMTTIPELLGPGESTSVTIKADYRNRYLSLAAMLIPTNDTFVALNQVALPYKGKRVYTALAYDAGTELNDQNCTHIPGPRCGGEGHSSEANEGDEGYVYVSNGFHDLGNEDENGNEILGPSVYDWRNPVARIMIRRIW